MIDIVVPTVENATKIIALHTHVNGADRRPVDVVQVKVVSHHEIGVMKHLLSLRLIAFVDFFGEICQVCRRLYEIRVVLGAATVGPR